MAFCLFAVDRPPLLETMAARASGALGSGAIAVSTKFLGLCSIVLERLEIAINCNLAGAELTLLRHRRTLRASEFWTGFRQRKPALDVCPFIAKSLNARFGSLSWLNAAQFRFEQLFDDTDAVAGKLSNWAGH